MKRIAAILCLLSLFFTCFSSCRRTENKPAQALEPEITDPNILTHIYRETARSAVQTATLTSGFVPFYDQETKTLTYLTEEYEAGAGGYTEKILYSIHQFIPFAVCQLRVICFKIALPIIVVQMDVTPNDMSFVSRPSSYCLLLLPAFVCLIKPITVG